MDDASQDLNNRLSHLEKTHLEMLATTRQHADHLKNIGDKVSELENSHENVRRQAQEATQLPAEHAAKMKELETRVRTCEGAIGTPLSSGTVTAEPVEPAPITPDSTDPKVQHIHEELAHLSEIERGLPDQPEIAHAAKNKRDGHHKPQHR